MSMEVDKKPNSPEKDPSSYIKYPVPFTSENASTVSRLLNSIVVSEVSGGIRSDVRDPEHEDLIDRLQREFMVASFQKETTPVLLSSQGISELDTHYKEYCERKGLTEAEIMECSRAMLILKQSLAGITGIPKEKGLSTFGVGEGSVALGWATKRAEKGAKDGLG